MVLHYRPKIVQNSHLVKKKLNLKNQEVLLAFWFINQEQKFSQTCCFCKIMVQSNIKKAIPDKSNYKFFVGHCSNGARNQECC